MTEEVLVSKAANAATPAGLWVGGRATLSRSELTFAPNGANKVIHRNFEPIRVPVAAITAVEVQRGILTNIVVIRTADTMHRIRCWGAKAFADRIDQARGAPHPE